MGILRNIESENKYKALIAGGLLSEGCILCKREPIKEFEYWKIINNEFPYDLIAEVHHMIVPKRHVSELELNDAEKREFDLIKRDYLHETYEFLIEGTNRKKSIPQHFHIHLIIAKN